MTDRFFQEFLNTFGEPQQVVPVTDDILNKFKGKLPNQLLEYWKQVGFSGFKEGLFWITNPDDYAESLYKWLADVEELNDDEWYVIARSGFGEFLLWGKKNWASYTLTITNGRFYKKLTGADDGETDSDLTIQYLFCFLTVDSVDYKAANKKSLFEKAVKKFGALKHDEVFGFEPAIILGGKAQISKVQKLDIHVHMDILKQFTKAYTTDIDGLGQILYGAPITPVLKQLDEQNAKKVAHADAIESGQPCPQSGYWYTAAKENSRQYFNQGDVFPEVQTDWSEVFWQFDGE